MTEKIQSNRIVCEGGLDTTENHINLSENKPGSATRLVNYEVGLDGGYRRINGFQPLREGYEIVDAAGSEGAILGVIIFENTASGLTEIYAARKTQGASEYQLFKDTVSGWAAVTTGFTLTYAEKLRYAVGNDGAKNILAIVDGVNYAYMFDGTNWTQIITANTGADFANAGGNQGVDAPSLVGFFKQTLFIGGDASAKGVVVYSAPNKFYDLTSASGAGQLTVGFPVVQYKPFRDSLFIFGFNAIKKASADTTAGFLLSDVTTNIGCVAPDTVVEIGGDLIFLAPDGFRPVAGTSKIGDVQLESISKPVQALLKSRIEAGLPLYTNSVAIRGKSQFRVFFSYDAVSEAASKGVIGALRTPDQFEGWEFGELQGFKVSTITSGYVDAVEYVVHGGFNGGVYRQEVGSTLNGENMIAVYSTPYIDFGDTEVRKVIEKISLFIKATEGFSGTLDISYDWGDTNVKNPDPYAFELASSFSTYGSGTYGTISYGSTVASRAIQDIQGSFFSMRTTLTTYGDVEPFSIHALIYEYQVKGRK